MGTRFDPLGSGSCARSLHRLTEGPRRDLPASVGAVLAKQDASVVEQHAAEGARWPVSLREGTEFSEQVRPADLAPLHCPEVERRHEVPQWPGELVELPDEDVDLPALCGPHQLIECRPPLRADRLACANRTFQIGATSPRPSRPGTFTTQTIERATQARDQVLRMASTSSRFRDVGEGERVRRTASVAQHRLPSDTHPGPG